nr:hypothetical protein Hi04_10k_c5016_00015 [uncultured bacterium]
MAKKSTTKPESAKKTTAKAKSAGKMSALDAAFKVLTEAGEPMTTGSMIEKMAAKKYWVSPGGQTTSICSMKKSSCDF